MLVDYSFSKKVSAYCMFVDKNSTLRLYCHIPHPPQEEIHDVYKTSAFFFIQTQNIMDISVQNDSF